MGSIPKALSINGKHYPPGELMILSDSLAAPDKPEWEQALGLFLRQWLDEKDYIEVMTSGSTGKPKLIMPEKKAMLTSATMTGEFLNLQKGQTALLCLKTSYIAGMMMVVRAMAWQMNLITVPPFGSPLDFIPDGQIINFAAMVPAQVFNSLGTPESKQKLENTGTLIIGGAPINRELENLLHPLKGNIYASFGMTETITHIALRRINGKQRSDFYNVLPGISVEADERGCLVARVPYLEQGTIITNDCVIIGSPGTFRWLGRIDHVINNGGLKLFPEEIESKAAPFIKQRFFIASQPDAKLGEIPCLVIESPMPLPENEVEQLFNKLRSALRKEEMPRLILYADNFTETENGKINRKESLEKAGK